MFRLNRQPWFWGFAVLAAGLGLAAPAGAQLEQQTFRPAPKYASSRAYSHFLHGRLYEQKGDFGDAVQQYREAIAHDPNSPQLRTALAQAYARLGQFDEAVAAALAALERDEHYAPAHYTLARIALARQRLPEATGHLEQVVSLDPGDLNAFDLLATIYLGRGDEQSAIALYRRLLEHHPYNNDATYRLAHLYWRQGETEKAKALLEQVAAREPGHEKALAALALLNEQRGDIDRARETYARILKYRPEDLDVMTTLLRLALRYGDEIGAEAYHAQIHHLSDDQAEISLKIGVMMYEERYYEMALKEFDQALGRKPELEIARLYAAWTLEKLKRYAAAPPYLDGVEKDGKYYPTALVIRAGIMRTEKRYGEAAALIKSGLPAFKNHPDYVDLLDSLAQTYEKAGLLPEAEEVLRKTEVSSAPASQAARHFALGLFYERQKRRDDALHEMQKVIAQDPEHAGALNFIGYSWAEMGKNLERAMEMIRQALYQRPDDGYITDSLGWAYYQKGDGKRALDLLQRANILAYREPVILDHLGDAYLNNSQPEKALDAYRQALKYEPEPELKTALEKKIRELAGAKNNQHP